MRHLKTWLIAAAAAGALTACNKPAEKAEGAADAGKAATAAAPAATPATPPKRKAGLWEQRVVMAQAGGGPALDQVTTQCVDPASEAEMAALGMQTSDAADCSQQAFSRRADGAWEFSSVCAMGEAGTVASKGVVTGDFGSGYRMEMTSTTTGAASPHMNGERHMTMTAAWKGACPSDMKPGDIRISGMPGMPGGATFNPSEMMKSAEGLRPPAAPSR